MVIKIVHVHTLPRCLSQEASQHPSLTHSIVMTDSDYLCIGNIEHLKDKPHEQVASAMLHELARLVGPIMIQRKYKIDTLMEFFPKDKHLNGRPSPASLFHDCP